MTNITIYNDVNPKSPSRLILDLVPTGIQNAVSMSYVARILNTDERTVRSMVEKARQDGNIIAVCEDGYFIPDTLEDLLDYRSTQLKRIFSSICAIESAFAFTGESILFEVLNNGGSENENE